MKYLKNMDGQQNCLVIGIVSDADAASYKRQPVLDDCPLIVAAEFMDQHNIDVVAHGFMDDADFERQKDFFEIPMQQQKFRRVDYNHGISTSEIIERIKQNY